MSKNNYIETSNFEFKNNRYYCLDCDLSFRKKRSIPAHKTLHDPQNEFLNKYIKHSLDDIEYVNGTPKVVYVCWFGGYKKNCPLMSWNRFCAFKSIVENISVPVILITYCNYKSFEKKDYPINKSFEYLSGVHKSDYFRVYMLKHYGGGYHDIKWRNDSWEDEWDKDNWSNDENIWMYGRREKNKNAVGYPPGKKDIQEEYKKLITMCFIICKKNTVFTNELLQNIENILDEKYDKLLINPGINSAGYYFENPFDIVKENSYPLRWLEILGEIFHPLMFKYNKHIKFGLKDAIAKKRYK